MDDRAIAAHAEEMYPERLIAVSDNTDEDGVFRRTCVLPYNSVDAEMVEIMRAVQQALDFRTGADDNEDLAADDASQQYFLERFAVGVDKEGDDDDDGGHVMVSVPRFRDGRRGRFLHDFTYNQSLIVDRSKAHCFVMPLDHATVMKPRNMLDMIVKMNEGYYNIDTNVVRKNMRVVLPALNDTSALAPRILNECEHMEIFRLEPITGRGKWMTTETGLIVCESCTVNISFLPPSVFKRSVDNLPDSAKYAHFSGHNIVEMNLDNYKQLQQYVANRK